MPKFGQAFAIYAKKYIFLSLLINLFVAVSFQKKEYEVNNKKREGGWGRGGIYILYFVNNILWWKIENNLGSFYYLMDTCNIMR